MADQFKCGLCNTPIDNDIVKEYEETSSEPFKEGYCSDKCKETDGMITQHEGGR